MNDFQLVVQDESELVAEAEKKKLKKLRLQALRDFKEKMSLEIKLNGSMSEEKRFAMFQSYFAKCKFTVQEAWQCLFVQTFQRGMNLKTNEERKHHSRDFLTDRNGFVDNIRTSKNAEFLTDVGNKYKRRAERGMQIYKTCQDTLNNIDNEVQLSLAQDSDARRISNG